MKKEVRLLKYLSNYPQQYFRRDSDRCNSYPNKNDRKNYNRNRNEWKVRFPFKRLSDYNDKSKDHSFKHHSIEHRFIKHCSVEYRSTEYRRFKQCSYDHRIYNKNKAKIFIIYSDSDDNN